METVVVLNHEHMGHPDGGLGGRILKTFLQKVHRLRGLEALLLYNGAVKLVARESPIRAELMLLEEHGVDVLPCATCLEFYGVIPAVGRVSSMDELIAAMDHAKKVITL